MFTLFLSACQPGQHAPSYPSELESAPISIEEYGDKRLVLPVPTSQPARFPPQNPLIHLPTSAQVSLLVGVETSAVTFNLKKVSASFDNPLYTFESVASNGANYRIKSPWKTIWADLRSFYVYAGDSPGKGSPIGYIHHSQGNFALESAAKVTLQEQSKLAEFAFPTEVITADLQICPEGVEKLGKITCNAYIGLYNTFGKIDYQSFGKTSPRVARYSMAHLTIMRLIKSYFQFDGDKSSLQNEYLIPLLKALKEVEKVPTDIDEETQLEASAQVYAKLLIVAMDTTLKTQKMMPQAFEKMNHLALGSALFYLNSETLNDGRVKQPLWNDSATGPVLRDTAILTYDLILNGTNTPMPSRIAKLLSLKSSLTEIITKLCKDALDQDKLTCIEAVTE